MKLFRMIALVMIAAMLGTIAPAVPVSADGGASTRNIILGGAAAAAALIIINHNKQVHARYAADAAQQAALASQRNDAIAAYNSEKKAYDSEALLVDDLRKEVAYQHNIVDQQKQQLSAVQASGAPRPANFVAQTTLVEQTPVGGQQPVAVVSYGWGTI
jgi:hypothetical protein